jgi:hypothetical protein
MEIGLSPCGEKQRLKVPEIRVLVIFGLMEEEVMGEWGKLHNGELRNMYQLPNRNRMNKSKGMEGGMEGRRNTRNAYKISRKEKTCKGVYDRHLN